jgi:hypothetical protein
MKKKLTTNADAPRCLQTKHHDRRRARSGLIARCIKSDDKRRKLYE